MGKEEGINEHGKSGKGYRKIENKSTITPLYTIIEPTTGNVTTQKGSPMTTSYGKLITTKNIETYTTILESTDAFGNITYNVPDQN